MLKVNKKGQPVIETEVVVPYRLAQGRTWHRFYEGFKEEKIFGTRCPSCKRVLVPARSFCPRCFVDMDEWIELPQEGTVLAWALTNFQFFGMPFEPPFITAMIQLDGSDCGFFHVVGGFDLSDMDIVNKTMKRNLKVEAVWKKEKKGCLLDIDYFKPIS